MNDKDYDRREELEIIKKNDKFLTKANVVFTIFLAVAFVMSFVYAILMFVDNQILIGVLILVFSTISIFVLYVLIKLLLSVMFDIRMIRNKLYSIDNSTVYSLFDEKFEGNPKFINDTENSGND